MNITPQAFRCVIVMITLFAFTATFSNTVSAQDGVMKFSLIPISADGDHAIMGNRIVLAHGGQRLVFEFYYSGWAPELLAYFQYGLDSSGYWNGMGEPLEHLTLRPGAL